MLLTLKLPVVCNANPRQTLCRPDAGLVHWYFAALAIRCLCHTDRAPCMHRRFYTLQTMHKVAERAQSQILPPAGEQFGHCNNLHGSLHCVCCPSQSRSCLLSRPFEHVPYHLPWCHPNTAQLDPSSLVIPFTRSMQITTMSPIYCTFGTLLMTSHTIH